MGQGDNSQNFSDSLKVPLGHGVHKSNVAASVGVYLKN